MNQPLARRRTGNSRMAVLIACAALTATACGSTVQTSGQTGALRSGGTGAAGQGGDGLGGITGSGTTGAGGTTAGGGSLSGTTGGAPGSGLAGAGTSVGGGGSGAGTAAGGAPTGTTGSRTQTGPVGGGTVPGSAGGASGPGVTAKTITIGVGYVVNSDAGNKTLGANGSGVTSGDQEGEAHALVDDINANGGLAGRKLVPVYHKLDATSGKSQAQFESEECADYTQDHHVFAAIGGGTENYLQCMQNGGALTVGSQIAFDTEATFSRFPYYYDVSELTLDRLASGLTTTLLQNKYFTPWDNTAGKPGNATSSPVKVGILVPDRPNDNYAIDHVLLPMLKRNGINVDPNDVFRWAFPQSAGDNGKSVSDIQSAVLRFRSDHVTHVIPTEFNGLVFMNKSAEQQNYRPRYGISTAAAPQAWLDAGLIDPHQLAGATGLGWSPILDLPARANPDDGRYSTPARRHCVAVLKARDITFTSTNAEGAALNYCDLFYSLQRALGSIAGPVNRNAAMAAVDRLGSSYQSAYLGPVFYGPGHRDPVGTGYGYSFSQSCGCMQYSGGSFKIP